MSTSFLEIAKIMDPVEPVSSLRELANRHRWSGGLPPVVSLRLLGMRHNHPDTTKHRMLWLNSWLVPGFQLSLCNSIQIGRLMTVLGLYLKDLWLSGLIPANELIDKFNLTSQQLADAFNLSKELLVDKFPEIAHSFVKEVKKWLPPPLDFVWETVTKPVEEVTRGDMLGKLSPHQLVERIEFMTPDQIIEKVGLDAGQVAAAFCEEIAGWIEEKTGWPINYTWVTIGEEAPNRVARSKAIGRILAQDYDIAGLCEVFEPDRQKDLVKAAGESGRKTTGHFGPSADGEIAGSGLVTVTFDGRGKSGSTAMFPDLPGLSFFEGNSKTMHVFSNQGDHVRDADAWSRKGVMLTVLNVGVGKIDLYTTHLYNGGDALKDPTDDQRWAVKLSQIKEIVGFIGDTHNSGHVTVLMGDFNVAAHDPEYSIMVQRLATADLVDLWPFWSQMHVSSGSVAHRGATNDPSLCELANTAKPYCAEPGTQEVAPVGRRIDYIFVEKPHADHLFTVDFARVRRRGDQFNGDKLSDHLGLDIGLVVSPPVHLPAL